MKIETKIQLMKNQTTKGVFLALVCLLCAGFTQAQRIAVSGTVTDNSNVPIPGANIVEKGTNNGVFTDFDGNYTIEVADGATLVVSYIGYSTREVPVAGNATINVILIESTSRLDEVVVVAYGAQKKETITSSVVSVKSEELKDISTPDVSSMLQGKASGVLVSAQSGSPGSRPNILIRGVSSLNGSITPLWVIDGVIQPGVPIVNPEDVESITVLKDASATALYGSRGSNGVIVVTTRRGVAGQKPQIKISHKTGVVRFNSGNFEVMNSAQLVDYQSSFNSPILGEDFANRDTDWVDLATRDGLLTDSNVTFTAADERLNLFLNIGIYTEESTVQRRDLNRYTFRTNLDYKINDKLTIKPKISLNFDEYGDNRDISLYTSLTNLPWDLPFTSDGAIVNPLDDPGAWIGRDDVNPYYDQQFNFSSYNEFNLSGNFDFEYKLFPNLTFYSTNNFTLLESRTENYFDPRSNAAIAVNGRVNSSRGHRLTRLSTQLLRYSNTFNEKHNVNLTAAYEFNDETFKSIRAAGTGIIPGATVLEVTANPEAIQGNRSEYAFQSFFLAGEYDFNEKYFVKGSVRRDGSSRFGPDNQYGTFFSAGAGWNVHKEKFFNIPAINQLKLRASYGSVGNVPLSRYAYQDTYRIFGIQYFGNPGATLNQFGNPDLQWERSFEANFALDATLFNRLNITAEYYNKDTSDLLYLIPLPSAAGYTAFNENVGRITNKGLELAVSGDVLQSQDFNFNLGFNVAFNDNVIEELFQDEDQVIGGLKILSVGSDYNTWYLRRWAGVNPADGAPLWEVIDPDTGAVDVTSDYNAATIQQVGTSTPDFIGGFNSSVTYKNFSFRTNFSFSYGGEIYHRGREFFDSDGFYDTYNQMVLPDTWNRWEQPGDLATHPRPLTGGNSNSNQPSSRYLEDGSYLRLNNATFSYALPQSLADRLGIANANIYLSGDNLYTWTRFTGFDPTVGNIATSSDGNRGIITSTIPVPRRFIVGLNVTF